MSGLSSIQEHFEQLTLGVIKTLMLRPAVKDVCHHHKAAAEHHEILTWEQKHSCMMPEDLKNFYLTSDGFLLTWNVKMNDVAIHLGRMEINSISQLHKIGSSGKDNPAHPSLADLECDPDQEDQADVPHFDSRSRIFELDPCSGNGKVCLVYQDTKAGLPARAPTVWLLDRALQWHFMAESFSVYYRLMLAHLGLPQWQFICTDLGISPQAKQWYNMLAPVRLQMDEYENSALFNDVEQAVVNHIDVNRVFKGKTDKKKPGAAAGGQGQAAKKRPPPTGSAKQPAGGSRLVGNQPSKLGR